MTRLILTADSSTAGALVGARADNLAIAIERRLVWGALPSEVQLDAFFAARTTQENGLHWLDDTPSWRFKEFGVTDLGLIELCSKCESVELWIDPEPNAQLMLLWLLNYWRARTTATQYWLCVRQMLPSAVRSQSNWRSLTCLPSRSQAITSNWPLWPGEPTVRRRRKLGSTC